ncbi:MAG: hypothetical protein JO079_07275 [Frankiaceae bacterium]|nr:hypothetical protein [Frankiaceae bacterium]
MRYKLTFAVGFATGYTLGAKAGRERYEQISRVLHGVAESPTVQSAAGVLQAQAGKVVDNARSTLLGKLPISTGGRDPYGPGPVPAMNGHGTTPPH